MATRAASPKTPSYQQVKTALEDREWRLDHLYWIQDKDGREVRFVRNACQLDFWESLWYRNIVLKARQLGFSTFIAIFMLDSCLFNSNTAAGIIDQTLPDAKKKLAKIKFAYDRLPAEIRERVTLTKENTEELHFSNGSRIEVGTSHRGGTLQILHVSEFGKISADNPGKANEIKRGAFGTVSRGQLIFVESTAEGTGGEFYDLVQSAERRQQMDKELSELDFKLQFFPWWRDPDYVTDPARVVITEEMEEYFEALAADHDIHLSEEQEAWYVVTRSNTGPDDTWKEYPSEQAEPFLAAIKGAYFATQMTKMRLTQRIGQVPHDESRLVNTFWDIGMNDQTCVWFHQSDGVHHRLINYFEDSGEGVGFYVRKLRDFERELGYQYGRHYGPHDLENREWGSPEGNTRRETALELGLEFDVVPRIKHKPDAIEAARVMLGLTWVDEKMCERGLQCLDNYRKDWDEARSTYKNQPRHDWASHGADALMTGAQGYAPEWHVPGEEEDYAHERTAPDRDRSATTGY